VAEVSWWQRTRGKRLRAVAPTVPGVVVLVLAVLGVASLIERGSGWLELATSIGTIGAALFAGVAAWIAAASASASRELVKIERARDEAQEDLSRVRQARSTLLDMRIEPDVRASRGIQVMIVNAGSEPAYQCRIKVVHATEVWGPISCGTLAPRDTLNAVFGLDFFTQGAPIDLFQLEASATFVDARGQHWLLQRDAEPRYLSIDEITDWRCESSKWELERLPTLDWASSGVSGPASLGNALEDYQALRQRRTRPHPYGPSELRTSL